MKISTLLVCVFVTSISASVLSQNTKLTLETQSMTIRDVLKSIEAQSNFRFFYNDEFLDLNKTVAIPANNVQIEEILDKLVADTEISYKVLENNLIVFTPKEMYQQQRISGTVTDASTGEPLPGVYIRVEGTNTGSVTDTEGKYTLEISDPNAVLVFSFVGYNSENVVVSGKSVIDMALVAELKELEEVVVIGYGTQKKGDITSSIASVKQESFMKGNVQDVGQLIQGKVAGLTIYNVSGDPTSNTQIKLRGNSTLGNTNSNPLILVDGVPGDFNSVAPEDIESIDVLKDGSAAAIYGTQGTNGVIILTTTRASSKHINTVEYSGYVSTQTVAKKLEMSTAADVREQIAKGYRSNSYDLLNETDWFDEITRTPVSHVHNLTLRGGREQTNYLFNVNYKSLQGIFLKSDNKVANFRADINHSMFKDMVKINIGAISRFINYQTSGDGFSFDGYTYRQANIYNPTAPVKNEDGSWYEEVGAFNYDNPVSRLRESNGENGSNWSRVNFNISVRPIKDLKLSALLSYSKYNEERGYSETKKHISTLRYGRNGYASNGTEESVDRLAEFTADYSKTMGNHRMTLLGGYSYKDYEMREFWQRNVDFPTDAFGYNDIDLGNGFAEGNPLAGIGSSKDVTNLIAFFGRATYSFNEKYLFMGSLRYEAASQLYGTKDPWGLFPAVSVGWRISSEPFMKNLTFINDLKLRAGYGVTGTQPSNLFLGLAALEYSESFYSNGVWRRSLAPSRNANPYLRWEEKKETNIGLDYALMNNRISGSVDYYIRKIDGLLMDYQVPVPPNLVSTTMANVGEMENKGIEVLLNIVPVRKRDFEWTTSLNFSTNENKLNTLSNELYTNTSGYIRAGGTGEPIQTYTHRLDVGGKIGNFYGFKVVDISDDGRWIYQNADGERVASQDFTRDEEDKMVLGNGLPKYYAGWNNSVRYKNLDLGISMRGAFGFQILNYDRMYLENTQTVTYNRLRSAYDEVFGKAVLSDIEDLEYNSYYIEDGDYWKIDNITLGYNFKMDKIKFVNSARVYFSSLNTMTITGYKGVDPEVQIDGLEPGNDYRDKYPTTRTFTLGFNVKF